MGSSRAERGRAKFKQVYGSRTASAVERLERLDPELVDWADSFVFGRVWERDGLELERRFLVAITALASLARYQQLPNYINGALEAGLPAEEIKEALMMMYVYAGFPVASACLDIFEEVIAEHAARTP